jgi:hypothetical protein
LGLGHYLTGDRSHCHNSQDLSRAVGHDDFAAVAARATAPED